MGASCSRSSRSAVVATTELADRATFASRQRTTPTPLLAYLAELEAADRDSLELSRQRRQGWRRDNNTRRRFMPASEEDEADRLHEIEVLQQSLAAMEDFFQSLLGQANFIQAMDPAGSGTGGPPPASDEALRGLPHVALTTSDIDDESNRTCGICCETHAIGARVTRLPCGHVYHGPCIEAWLNRHCTCPVCRYELATDDDSYEPGRLERMGTRKLPSECEIRDEEDQDLSVSLDDKVVKT